jgi:hypothetical protein
LVEGATEEDFVNEVLRNHLAHKGVLVDATGIGESRARRGIVPWISALRNVRAFLKSDQSAYVTTFVDYYALPSSWPGRDEAAAQPYDKRSAFLSGRLVAAMAAELGDRWRPERFIPFVMIHEFEALIFSDAAGAARAWAQPDAEAALSAIRQSFPSAEAINDSPETAPSKRLEAVFTELRIGHYDKRTHGNIAALELGLGTLAAACPQFGSWLTRLENLGTQN